MKFKIVTSDQRWLELNQGMAAKEGKIDELEREISKVYMYMCMYMYFALNSRHYNQDFQFSIAIIDNLTISNNKLTQFPNT